jgi:hypothetical protein
MNEKKFFRNCPQCNKVLSYTNSNNRQRAEKDKVICRSCSTKNRNLSGENNPFYGKQHTKETKQKLSDISFSHIYTEEQKEQARTQLAKVSNSIPLYDIWLTKYGKEEADKRLTQFKTKQSKNNKGKNNHMFGKPAPQGSGNGWSGWYKNWYFRSLRELSYMINVIEKENLVWQTPDKNYKIPYIDYAGEPRTYFPDFIIGNKLVEIKPLKLQNTPKVLAKKNAAEEFCQKQNMIYEIIDPPILSEEEVKNLYINGQIKFLDKYEQKFKERYLI